MRQWFELRQEWTTNGNVCTALSADFRLAGGMVWTNLYASPASFNVGAALTSVSGGLVNSSGQDSVIRGRYGMPGLYVMGAWADRLLPVTDVADPPAGPFGWYVNPAVGSDANDGTSAATAWASVAKLNAESANCGMFGRAGYANGDTLTIDTTTANLVMGSASLNLNTQGLNVTQVGGGLTGTGEIQAWENVSGNGWTLVGGAAKTYQRTLSSTDACAVLWENDRWLNHSAGSALSDVLAALESTPGSFWTDGATMYVHPSGDTNPASDGKTYTRSYHRGAPFGGPAVQLLAPDLHLKGLRCAQDLPRGPRHQRPRGRLLLPDRGRGRWHDPRRKLLRRLRRQAHLRLHR